MARDMFAELVEGFDALAAERAGQLELRKQKKVTKRDIGTLITHKISPVRPDELKALREKLHLSQPVLASYLRISPRTLQNWEQGKSKPNDQASLLLRLVERDQQVLQLLAAV